jgi:hypothetical protein
MEEEVWQRVVQQIGLSGQGPGGVPRLVGDLPRLGAVDLRGPDAVHECQRLVDACFQLRERRLVVLEHGRFDPRESRYATLGVVRRDLYLPREVQHVRGEAIAE